MSVWNKVSQGLDRAAKVTGSAIDEGKLRVAAYRARQRADKRAETLGYVVARAKADGREPDPAALAHLVDAVSAAEAEARQLESQVKPAEPGAEAPAAATDEAHEGREG